MAVPNDHDLLIEVKTKLDAVIESLRELKDGTAQRLINLENNKLDREEAGKLHRDYERRLRFLERYMWGAIAILGAIQFVAQFLHV